MGLGIVKTSWTTVILPPYSSSIILGYLIYRKSFTHSPEFFSVQTALGDNIIDVGHYVYFVSLTVCITRPVVIPQSSAPIKDTTYLK